MKANTYSFDKYLSKSQRDIASHDEGAICVKASAGSGKTRVLVERVRYLLSAKRRRVLVLTFTNKAAEEVKDRISDIDATEKVFIGTFHGFCKRVIENHGHLVGLSERPYIFEDKNDRLELVEQAIQMAPHIFESYREKENGKKEAYKNEVLDFISKIKQNMGEIDSALENDSDKVILYQEYTEILKSQGGLDFDDLLLSAHTLFVESQDAAHLYRKVYPYICIDEAQDLNYAQYQLLLALTGGVHKNVMMVGDPNQSIFHFNGSSPKYMCEYFKRDFQPKTYKLKENYRSSIEILSATKKIFSDEMIPYTVKKGIFALKGLKDEGEETRFIADKIGWLMSEEKRNDSDIEGGITLEKMVIIARNKYLFRPIETELKSKGIPFYHKVSNGSVPFESDLMSLFAPAINVRFYPNVQLHKDRLCKNLGISRSDVSKSNALESIIQNTKDGLQREFLNVVLKIDEDGGNFKRVFEKFKQSLQIDDDRDRSIIIYDIDCLLGFWSRYMRKAENHSIQGFRNILVSGEVYESNVNKGVGLSTIHAMKGQESDIVFLMGMDDGVLPDYRAIDSGGAALDQEKNSLYVAFTRARRFLYVTWPQKRTTHQGGERQREVSRFLCHY